jgi:hypothetical protein
MHAPMRDRARSRIDPSARDSVSSISHAAPAPPGAARTDTTRPRIQLSFGAAGTSAPGGKSTPYRYCDDYGAILTSIDISGSPGVPCTVIVIPVHLPLGMFNAGVVF